MINLALSYNKEYLKINQIAESEGFSAKFLENIVSMIKPSGLLLVKRGAKGGYMLSKPPSQIKLMEIISAFNDQLLVTDTTSESKPDESTSEKVVNNMFAELASRISDFFEEKTLDKLAEEHNRLKPDQMFYI
jgi:Rrf2 family iron-sulfur cluster assembly transcriptional regulator